MTKNDSKYTILIIDDDSSHILLLKYLLKDKGFNLISTQNGFEALQIVSEQDIDLILLDIQMPEMNGFEVAKRLKNREETNSIPIIFISTLNASEDIIKGLSIGDSDFIAKPVNKKELFLRIERQLSFVDTKKLVLKQAEKLQEVIKSRDKLYSVIAHDLKSPVSTLKMALNVLSIKAKEKNIDKEFTDMLTSGEEISEEVFCLLDNLLKWAKSQTGVLEPIFQPYNLDEIIEGIAEITLSSAKVKNIDIEVNTTSPVRTMIDTDMIKSILRNFIYNAIKFSYPNSKIIVSLEKSDTEAIIKVQDQGCGISEENKNRLLNNMAGFTTYGTSREEGTGLGMLVSYHFIELHHGKLAIESEVGKGSCFSFTIPLQDASLPNQ